MTAPMFLTELSTLLESVALISMPVALVGDFNIHVNDKTDTDAKALLDILDIANLKQLINFPPIAREIHSILSLPIYQHGK